MSVNDTPVTTYYKATRVDGFSFYADKEGKCIAYVVGETTRIADADRKPELCTTGVLHASDTPNGTLIGGEWPCRLFEVTGTPVTGPEQHKLGFYELHVEREIEAWRALGPNGREVVAFIEAVKTIDAERMRGVTAAWAAWDARNAAWDAAGRRRGGRTAAGDAAGDAALALCARDLIIPEQFEILYAPWQSVIPVESL